LFDVTRRLGKGQRKKRKVLRPASVSVEEEGKSEGDVDPRASESKKKKRGGRKEKIFALYKRKNEGEEGRKVQWNPDSQQAKKKKKTGTDPLNNPHSDRRERERKKGENTRLAIIPCRRL